MLCLAIYVYEDASQQPAQSIRIPLAVITTIAKFIPASIAGKLQQRGIDVKQIVHEAGAKLEPGIIMEVCDDGDRVVIVVEHMGANTPLQLTDNTRDEQ